MSIVIANNLTKVFPVRHAGGGFKGAVTSLFARSKKLVTAVSDVSFQIERGEIVGFLGPNGAGKSTTLKMLTGVLHPTQGSVLINGISPHTNRINAVKNIGVTFGHRSQLIWDLRLEESFELLKRIYSIPNKLYKTNLSWLGDAMDFTKHLDVPVRQLSLGQRMRAEIAAALLHSPYIVFLDEPTIGLDLDAKDAIRSIIHKVNKEYNTTVILTSHDMDDIKELCTRLIIIDKGRIVQQGNIVTLLKTFAPSSLLMIEIGSDKVFDNHPQCETVKREGNRIWLKYDTNIITSGQLIGELCQKYELHDISIHPPDIEDVIRSYYSSRESITTVTK